ncbi:MAG: hypothetical protein ACLUNO_01515 [Oscillospiraceae bacterium]
MRTMKDGKIGPSSAAAATVPPARSAMAMSRHDDHRAAHQGARWLRHGGEEQHSLPLQPDLPLQVWHSDRNRTFYTSSPQKTKLPPRSLGGSFALRSALEFAAVAFQKL